MKLSKENIREKEFHNKLQSSNKKRFENIFYKAIGNINDDFFTFIKNNCKNKSVLDFGCGVGNTAKKISEYYPASICGIDISEVSIEKANKSAKELDLNIEYRVDNCENLSFEKETFDIIYGQGILHHLQLNLSLSEILRVLKKNGRMIFIEPLGSNPFINFYRYLTPKSRSKDEHPLLKKDFDFIEKTYGDIQVKYYGFLTLVFFFLYKNKSSFTFKILSYLDQLIFKIKFLRFLAWSVLIIAKKN